MQKPVRSRRVRAMLAGLAVLIAASMSACDSGTPEERVRVIVTLDVGELPATLSDENRRQRTREVRDALLAKLPSDSTELGDTMALSGSIVIELNAADLPVLRAAPEVKAVTPDRRVTTQGEDS